MIIHLEQEKSAVTYSSGGLKKRGGGAISAITLTGGIAASGSEVAIYDNTTASGTPIWTLKALQNDSASITFTKPIPFSTGLYVNLTPSGQSARVSIAFE